MRAAANAMAAHGPRAIVLALVLCAGAGAVPTFEEVRAAHRLSDVSVLDRGGRLLQERRIDGTGRRLDWTGLDQISPALQAAVIAAEDRRFYSHKGVDYRALAAALWSNIWRRGRPRGASTLTMQVASFLSPGLNAKRGRRDWLQKWRQMRDAWELERTWTKKQLFEAYLNLVSFRGELRGVGAAARGLFGKEPHGITDAEAWLMAALVRAPSGVPDAVARRACRLAQSMGEASRCEAVRVLASETLNGPTRIVPKARWAPHVADRLARASAGQTTVRTTLDLELQRYVLETLQGHLRPLRERHVHDGAVLVVDNATGEVLAYAGNQGADSAAVFVDGVQARRQAGSTLKPFLYALALQNRQVTTSSLLDDSPLDVPLQAGGAVYRPQNYDERFHGPVPLRVALGSSLNVPAVRALLLVGVGPFVELLSRLGLTGLRSAEHYGPSLALGSADVTLWELVGAYRALALGGRWGELTLTPREEPTPLRRVLGEEAAFLISTVLADRENRSLTFGWESPLSTRYWTAVKTGTSKDMRDNWCLGYSRRYTVGVWVGNFDGQPMWNVTGVSGAAPVWLAVMNRLHRDVPSTSPRPPAGVVEKTVTSRESSPRTEYFLDGTETQSVELADRRPRSRILYPSAGMLMALDPDIPPARQRIVFEAEGQGGPWRWELDGAAIGQSAEGRLAWSPTPGKHRLRLTDGSGRVADEVDFEVRGSVGVP